MTLNAVDRHGVLPGTGKYSPTACAGDHRSVAFTGRSEGVRMRMLIGSTDGRDINFRRRTR